MYYYIIIIFFFILETSLQKNVHAMAFDGINNSNL